MEHIKNNTIVLIIFLLFICILSVGGCRNSNDINSLNKKEQELKLKEKELQLKESEMLDKKEEELNTREKKLDNADNEQKGVDTKVKINLQGIYTGSIKDGTKWNVYITNFDGINFSGYNDIFWKKTPNGFKTNFSGVFDPSSREITMLEDRTAKGSGKFVGTVSIDGNSLSGDWHRYSDGNSFTWNLKKLIKE